MTKEKILELYKECFNVVTEEINDARLSSSACQTAAMLTELIVKNGDL